MAEPRRLLPLQMSEVSYRINGRTLIDRIDLSIRTGTRTVILGPNGAGKSVLMRLAHGLLEPTGGQIRWNVPEARPREQAMVFQRPVMLRRSARANIEYALKLAGVPAGQRAERAMAALARVGLETIAHNPARVLSGGEQQRLALARAWALEPQVLFLDEPTASLDPGAAREVEAIIDAIHAAGTKIVMSTHNLGQARRLADEILYLQAGRIEESTAAAEFFRQPRSAHAAAFIEGELPWR
ncbi:MAG: ATP-binding cassette domain-containing protein [Rhodocyclaceae bacterium]|nr:ATP-binding cassette domain-containing protein [Rhodocyclaceae bacterium]MBX3669124.1 ATP-binding cassette domain-containing protein [Rhodocyclaceae bacterium]